MYFTNKSSASDASKSNWSRLFCDRDFAPFAAAAVVLLCWDDAVVALLLLGAFFFAGGNAANNASASASKSELIFQLYKEMIF